MTARGYEKFMFECSTRYRTNERSERLRCWVEHENIKFISTSGHVVFCLLHKHTNDDVFDDFPKISDHFSDIFRRLPKISEERKRWCFDHTATHLASKYFLRDYVNKTMVIILVTMATPISSHVKDKNSISTAYEFSKRENPGIPQVFM